MADDELGKDIDAYMTMRTKLRKVPVSRNDRHFEEPNIFRRLSYRITDFFRQV
jgi:hypothetical protein